MMHLTMAEMHQRLNEMNSKYVSNLHTVNLDGLPKDSMQGK